MEEKRYYTRYKVNFPVIGADERGVKFNLETLDISAEGARFKAYEPLNLHKGERLYFLIKGKHKIKVKGEIRWIKKNQRETEFGVQFVDVDMATREVLSSLISDYALSSLLDSYLK